MLIINDHPDWKISLALNDYASHLVPSAIKPFTDLKIGVFKEEGNTLQVNQAYDQSAAKEAKKNISYWLDKCRGNCKLWILNQESIVSICIHALQQAYH